MVRSRTLALLRPLPLLSCRGLLTPSIDFRMASLALPSPWVLESLAIGSGGACVASTLWAPKGDSPCGVNPLSRHEEE